MSVRTLMPQSAPRRRSRLRPRIGRSWPLAAAALAVSALLQLSAASAASAAPSQPGAANSLNPVDTYRAVSSYDAMQANLYIPQYGLYVKSLSSQNFGFLWDFLNPWAATNYVAAIPGVGHRYRSDMLAQEHSLVAYYYDTHETDPTGAAQPPGFVSGVLPPLDSVQPTYYDDNAWVGLNLMQEYGLTHRRSALTYAETAFRFIVSGWDTRTTVACPGGVFWEDVAGSTRNTVSNAPNAEAGVEIYQATHDPYYLTWATRMYDWVRNCLENSSGMYYDHLDDSGNISNSLWSYNQGTMIGAGVLLYRATGDPTYLQQAEQTAAASVAYYGANDNLLHQPAVFNVILFRNLFSLAKINHDPSYAQMAAAYADTAWLQDRQSSGLLSDPDASGGESAENQTSPMTELYALLAEHRPVYAATGSTSPAAVTVQPSQSGTTTLSLQSVRGNRQTVKWTASAPSGFSVTPSSGSITVPGGGSASTPVAITGGPTDGNYKVTFSFASDSGRVLPITTSVIVARPGDLAPFYNNTGISDDTDQAAANMDGLGFSYSEQALTAAGLAPGASITSGGVQYNWPSAAAGQPDNLVAAGQVITVPAVAGATELGVIGSATNGPSSGTLTITYTDGTTQTATLGLSDWAGSTSFGNGIAASMPYRNSSGGSSQQLGMRVYTDNIPLAAGKTVASVTLPNGANQGLLHVFALGTDKGPLTTG